MSGSPNITEDGAAFGVIATDWCRRVISPPAMRESDRGLQRGLRSGRHSPHPLAVASIARADGSNAEFLFCPLEHLRVGDRQAAAQLVHAARAALGECLTRTCSHTDRHPFEIESTTSAGRIVGGKLRDPGKCADAGSRHYAISRAREGCRSASRLPYLHDAELSRLRSNAQAHQFFNGCRDNGAGHDLFGQVQCGGNPCRCCSSEGWILCRHVQFIPANSGARGSVRIGLTELRTPVVDYGVASRRAGTRGLCRNTSSVARLSRSNPRTSSSYRIDWMRSRLLATSAAGATARW
jgi:hypothetical protein